MVEKYKIDPKVKIIWIYPYVLALLIIWLISTIVLIVGQGSIPIGILPNLNPIIGSFTILILGIIIICVPAYVWFSIEHNNFSYEFSDTELIIKEGVIDKHRAVIPYKTINNINVKLTFVERMLKIGTIEIDTAAGGDKREGLIPGINDTDFVINKIHEMMEREGTQDNIKEKDTATVLNKILDELKEIKTVLSNKDNKSDDFKEIMVDNRKKRRRK